MTKGFVIAIDGPVAAGKGTIAKLLASRLHGFYLYTGGMYRSLALYAIEKGIALNDAQGIIDALPHVVIGLKDERVFLNGKDVTERIKEPDVASGASEVGVIREVREEMVRRQKQIVEENVEQNTIVIAEGRDEGTVLAPNAALKLFLTASPEVRAKRRFDQMEGDLSLQQLIDEVKKRDERDTKREADPLVSEPEKYGYTILDNSKLTQEQTLQVILDELKKRGLLT